MECQRGVWPSPGCNIEEFVCFSLYSFVVGSDISFCHSIASGYFSLSALLS